MKWYRVKVRAKGQVTIPKAVREAAGLEVGDLLEFTYNDAYDWIEIHKVSNQERERG